VAAAWGGTVVFLSALAGLVGLFIGMTASTRESMSDLVLEAVFGRSIGFEAVDNNDSVFADEGTELAFVNIGLYMTTRSVN